MSLQSINTCDKDAFSEKNRDCDANKAFSTSEKNDCEVINGSSSDLFDDPSTSMDKVSNTDNLEIKAREIVGRKLGNCNGVSIMNEKTSAGVVSESCVADSNISHNDDNALNEVQDEMERKTAGETNNGGLKNGCSKKGHSDAMDTDVPKSSSDANHRDEIDKDKKMTNEQPNDAIHESSNGDSGTEKLSNLASNDQRKNITVDDNTESKNGVENEYSSEADSGDQCIDSNESTDENNCDTSKTDHVEIVGKPNNIDCSSDDNVQQDDRSKEELPSPAIERIQIEETRNFPDTTVPETADDSDDSNEVTTDEQSEDSDDWETDMSESTEEEEQQNKMEKADQWEGEDSDEEWEDVDDSSESETMSNAADASEEVYESNEAADSEKDYYNFTPNTKDKDAEDYDSEISWDSDVYLSVGDEKCQRNLGEICKKEAIMEVISKSPVVDNLRISIGDGRTVVVNNQSGKYNQSFEKGQHDTEKIVSKDGIENVTPLDNLNKDKNITEHDVTTEYSDDDSDNWEDIDDSDKASEENVDENFTTGESNDEDDSEWEDVESSDTDVQFESECFNDDSPEDDLDVMERQMDGVDDTPADSDSWEDITDSDNDEQGDNQSGEETEAVEEHEDKEDEDVEMEAEEEFVVQEKDQEETEETHENREGAEKTEEIKKKD